MYRAREKQMSIYDYLPPYHGELCNANRWVRLAAAIDWDGFEKAYSALFAPGGKVALPRQALPPGMGFFAHIHDLDGNRVGLHAPN